MAGLLQIGNGLAGLFLVEQQDSEIVESVYRLRIQLERVAQATLRGRRVAQVEFGHSEVKESLSRTGIAARRLQEFLARFRISLLLEQAYTPRERGVFFLSVRGRRLAGFQSSRRRHVDQSEKQNAERHRSWGNR